MRHGEERREIEAQPRNCADGRNPMPYFRLIYEAVDHDEAVRWRGGELSLPH